MELLGFGFPDWIVALLFLLMLIYILATWTFDAFKKLGVAGPSPKPFIGNFGFVIKEGFYNFDVPLRKKYGKIYGYFEGSVPHLSIGDVDIVKQVLVKDFNKFTNRREFHFRGIFREAVFDARDQKWRDSRSILSPTFSSGKLKTLIPAMKECVETLIQNMGKLADAHEPMEMKEVCSRFTMDVIALTEFGMKLDTQNHPETTLLLRSQDIFRMPVTTPLVLLAFMAPGLCKIIESIRPMSILPSQTEDYFRDLINALLKERESSKSKHKDLVKLMMDAEGVDETAQGSNKEAKRLSREQIIDNAVIFILAGYETTATTLAFLFYHLAVNQDVQDRVREEIFSNIDEEEVITPDLLQKMSYLEMCINETLRMYPPVPRVDRMAQEKMTYDGLTIPKGMTVDIPIRALQLDPDAWPEPETFDPERFSPEAKAERNPYYFMPFGSGPRMCIGQRLAMLEMKTCVSLVFKRFRFVPCEKTEEPLNIDTSGFGPRAVNGIWIQAEKIN